MYLVNSNHPYSTNLLKNGLKFTPKTAGGGNLGRVDRLNEPNSDTISITCLGKRVDGFVSGWRVVLGWHL